MPSIRKRIGYLPSINIQEIISKLAEKEKLSQSKVVGILVEEALIARGVFDHQNPNDLIKRNSYIKVNNMTNYSIEYINFDELISDKGIKCNIKRCNKILNNSSLDSKNLIIKIYLSSSDILFCFKKMTEENNNSF